MTQAPGTTATLARQTASGDEFERQLGQELIARELLSGRQLREALLRKNAEQCSLPDALLEFTGIDAEPLLELCGELLDVPSVDLSKTPGDARVLEILPRRKAFELSAIPLFAIQNQVTVAVAEPFDLEKLDTLRFITGREVLPVFALRTDICRHLTRYYGEYDPLFDPFEIEFESPGEDADGDVSIDELEAERPTVRLVNLILSSCIGEAATDIHLEPRRGFMAVRSRVDDILRLKPYQIPRDAVPGVISRIKILSNLDISEKRRPQDGKIGILYQGRRIDVRVSTFPTIHGEKLVLRLLDKERTDFQLETIGMERDTLERWRSLLGLREGIVLVTGPTGSGKSSTLFASLRHLHRPEVNIVTLEDPVEYELEGISQGQVQPAAGFTFATGLKSILRQDPDIIQVGEIRDLETAEIAVRAALTGHLVLATLHTNDAPSAVTRLVDIGLKPYLVAAALRGVLAQRLVRRPCPECLEIAKPDSAEQAELARMGVRAPFKEGAGCTACQESGYKGRTGVYELLEVGRALASTISESGSEQLIAGEAAGLGYSTLWSDGLVKVDSDRTTLRELMRVLPREEGDATKR